MDSFSPAGVIKLAKTQLRRAEEVFSLAFEDYPLFTAIFPDRDERKKKMPYFFRFVLRYGLRYGCALASSGLESAAIVLPPNGIKMTAWKQIVSGVNMFGRHTGVKKAFALGRITGKFFEAQERLAPFPHWYLMFIAVKPDSQGKGFGRALMDAAFELASKERLPLYLETQLDADIAIYEKLGFKKLDVTKVPGYDISNVCMLKDT